MSINLKSNVFLKKMLPHTLIMSMAIGMLFFFSPLTMGNNCEVEADVTNRYFINSRRNELDLSNRYSFSNDNTLYSQSAINIEPKVNAVMVEKETKEKPVKVSKTINTTITGYSSTVDQTNSEPFITASGYWVRDGIVATNFLPFGTKIRIPEFFGDKVFTVKDRMNRRHNDRVDIWFSTRQQAINFGIQYTYIEVIE